MPNKKLKELVRSKNFFYIVYFILALVILASLLSDGYVLTLDLVFARKFDATKLLGLDTEEYIHATTPLMALLIFLGNFIAYPAIEKFFLFLIFFISGASAHRLFPEKSYAAKYFMGTLYMINPFVYIRFLAGHWLILLAFAFAPFAVKFFIDLLERPNRRSFLGTLLVLTLITIFDLRVFLMVLLLLFIFSIAKIIQVRRNAELKTVLKNLLLLAALFIALNLFWILPLSSPASLALTGRIGAQDIGIFSAKTTIFNAVFSVASMFGFWRGGYIYPVHIVPYLYLLYVAILFLAIYGFLTNSSSKRYGIYIKGLAVGMLIAVILGSGTSEPFQSLYTFLFENVPLLKGFRDSQKFVAILVLGYAFLGAYGVAEFEKKAKKIFSKRKIAVLALIALILLIPFTYSFTIFNGFAGQLKPINYPQSWYQTNDYLNQDGDDFNVIFFPWHQYMTFSWSGVRLGNPAQIFFDKPVIQAKNIEVAGIYTESTNPTQSYIQFLLDHRDTIDNFGELVSPLNVKYIILAKEVDYPAYDFLFKQKDLVKVKDVEDLILFKNLHETSRIYGVDSVVKIERWDKLVELSKGADILDFAYASNFSDLNASSSRLNLNYSHNLLYDYTIGETDKRYVVFTPPNQDSTYWTLGGRAPIDTSGINAVFSVHDSDNNDNITFTRSRLYLVGYILSLVSFAVLPLTSRKIMRPSKVESNGS